MAQLAPAVDGLRLTLHVLAASVWVGGQLTLAGLVPSARRLGERAPSELARAFARMQWPAYGVLLVTGIWNVAAAGRAQPHAWQVVLGVKVAVALLSGASAFLHTRTNTKTARAAWGATSASSAVAALALGVFLAG